ncbi:threonine/serine dehydratase [Hyphobacterium sp. HN65]|uniref:Threonine/serine dehydratase n=1 Tax=Hyphobacterium lacteum TaxID=3116575 RepID=A0ABU7LMA4_9PROT|nr:threonine/serine dehydratase [Hyphobacterium sp. HN65]MEE2525065.1 threonine/serine dehydratase [Hyphobacterium sp. HN65]
MDHLPTIEDIRSAAGQIAGEAYRTPLLENDVLNARAGGRVLIKPECLQRTGSFKFRGAYNRLSRIPESDREKGVVAFSSGNHAQGVALAAKLLGIPATIVMPWDAPAIKVEGVKRSGGRIVEFDRASGDREAISQELVEESGATLVPSYDNFHIMAGQGTAGLEIAEDLSAAGITPDQLVCCAGGGGLIAGTGMAIRERFPDCELWAAEPEGFDDHRKSLAAGDWVANERRSGSIQDAIITPSPGKLTFQINRHQLTGAVTASDDDTLEAMAFIWKHLKLVGEPGGSTAFAALLNGQMDLKDKTTVVLITGGNVDPAIFQRALERV